MTGNCPDPMPSPWLHSDNYGVILESELPLTAGFNLTVGKLRPPYSSCPPYVLTSTPTKVISQQPFAGSSTLPRQFPRNVVLGRIKKNDIIEE